MTAEIIAFKSSPASRGLPARAALDPERKNMHTFLFRSREAILESDEADLIADVRFDLHKAQVKLERMRTGRQSLQERTTAELRLSIAADIKLTAAIVAALLSSR